MVDGWLTLTSPYSASAGTVKLWEVATTRCARTFNLGAEVRAVRWCPNSDTALAAAVVGNKMVLLLPLRKPLPAAERAAALLEPAAGSEEEESLGNTEGGGVVWTRPTAELRAAGVACEVGVNRNIYIYIDTYTYI